MPTATPSPERKRTGDERPDQNGIERYVDGEARPVRSKWEQPAAGRRHRRRANWNGGMNLRSRLPIVLESNPSHHTQSRPAMSDLHRKTRRFRIVTRRSGRSLRHHAPFRHIAWRVRATDIGEPPSTDKQNLTSGCAGTKVEPTGLFRMGAEEGSAIGHVHKRKSPRHCDVHDRAEQEEHRNAAGPSRHHGDCTAWRTPCGAFRSIDIAESASQGVTVRLAALGVLADAAGCVGTSRAAGVVTFR